MIKNEVIDVLRNAEYPTAIAEVICDVEGMTCGKHENVSIIVFLDFNASDDQIIRSKHWWTCGCIDEFEAAVLDKEEAETTLTYWYVTEFKEVKPFTSDFQTA